MAKKNAAMRRRYSAARKGKLRLKPAVKSKRKRAPTWTPRLDAIETLQAIARRWPEIFEKGFESSDFVNPDQLHCVEQAMLEFKRSPLTKPWRERTPSRVGKRHRR